MMPYLTETVLPWFARYGATTTEPRLFKIFIEDVEKDSATIRALLPEYERAGFDDIVTECNDLLRKADDVVAKMRARLAELGPA